MKKTEKIYIAGHRGLVGSAIIRNLQAKGYTNLITRTHKDLDLTDQLKTRSFFETEKPDYVFLAAAKVGGINANNNFPADFIRDNLAIQSNVIEAAYVNRVRRLLFLGSSCVYPKFAPQPMKEEHLLTGPLEPTNRPYAIAKIAGIEMCWSYNQQYGTRYLAVMPTNLYGPEDNYHLENSHVIPALIRKVHEAKVTNAKEVVVWGTGTPRREFMYSEDMADGCVYLMNLSENKFLDLLSIDKSRVDQSNRSIVNMGVGGDISIRELANLIIKIVGFEGNLVFDSGKPDGTPRKLLDVSRLAEMGWRPHTALEAGLKLVYREYQSG